MKKDSPEINVAFTPLAEALERIQFWLTKNDISRVIVAAPSWRELKRKNNLPPHVQVTQKPLKGPRVPVRGRRHFDQVQMRVARWPEDGLDENPLPALACVLSGQADLIVADYVLHCQTGDIIFFPPRIPKQDGSKPHFEGDTTGRQCDLLWIYSGSTGNQGVESWICHSEENAHSTGTALGTCSVIHPFLAQTFAGLSEELLRQPQSRKRYQSDLIYHLLTSIFLLLQGEIVEGRAFLRRSQRPLEAPKNHSHPIAQACEYIESNLQRPLTIEQTARQVAVSPSTFTRRFREHTGQSFKEYLTAQRLKLAESLLRETEIPVDNICLRVGLQYDQLRRLFHQHHGCTPGDFRLRERVQNQCL